jgi:LysR family transcriptional activator of nhaA
MSTLPWLNYHHLLYFHATARDGSMSAAAKKLRLAQPTLSGQIKQLEESLGEPLFERRGKRLELTPMGRTVYQYADEIFGLGQELLHAVRGKPAGRALRFSVGVSDALPKLVIYRLLEPVLALEGGARLDLRDGDLPSLLAELGAHRLDLVLTDAPLAADGGIRAYSHSLGESSVTFFGTPSLAAALRPGFPGSLDRAHMLLPGRAIALRRSLDEWMDRLGIVPDIVAEIQDSALLKAFGHRGVGVFAAPTIVAREVTEQFGVEPIGVAEEVVERFWAISAERRIRHPALGAVVAGARTLFAGAVR